MENVTWPQGVSDGGVKGHCGLIFGRPNYVISLFFIFNISPNLYILCEHKNIKSYSRGKT